MGTVGPFYTPRVKEGGGGGFWNHCPSVFLSVCPILSEWYLLNRSTVIRHSGLVDVNMWMLCVCLQYKFAVIVMGRQEYITEEDKPINMNQFMPQHLHGQCMCLLTAFTFLPPLFVRDNPVPLTGC